MPFSSTASIAGLMGGLGLINGPSQSMGLAYTAEQQAMSQLLAMQAQIQAQAQAQANQPWWADPLRYQGTDPLMDYQSLMNQAMGGGPRPVEVAAPIAEPMPHVVLDLDDAPEVRQPEIVAHAVDIEGCE